MSAIQEVEKITGFDPTKITPDNVHLAAFWIPSLIYEYKLLAVGRMDKVASHKIQKEKAHRKERTRLMELRGKGGRGSTLTDDAVKFLASRSDSVLQYDEAVRRLKREADQFDAYRQALKDAYGVVLCYLGHLREEVKVGVVKHKLSHHFKPRDSVVESVPYDPETGEVIEDSS